MLIVLLYTCTIIMIMVYNETNCQKRMGNYILTTEYVITFTTHCIIKQETKKNLYLSSQCFLKINVQVYVTIRKSFKLLIQNRILIKSQE